MGYRGVGRFPSNLGYAGSLATQPATTTIMEIGPEERARLGISDGAIRLSVGLEDPADLIEDLARGVAALRSTDGRQPR